MKHILPVKILKSQGNIENINSLLKKKALQIGYHEEDLTLLKGKTSLLFDFGKELSGGVRILTHSAEKNTRVRLRFGESASEALSEIGEKNSTNDHSTRDMIVNLQSWSDLCFGQTGFRFLKIDTLCDDDNLAIKTIVAKTDTDERAETGRFLCDDEILNNIWSTASYTLRLCLKNGYFWDGVKRDRLVWIGDLYPEMKAGNYLYDNCDETLNSLDFAFNETKLPRWVADMPAYSLWWLVILEEEYFMRDDKNIIKPYLNYIKGLVLQISGFVNDKGETTYPFNFIDWPSQPQDDNPQVFNDNLAGMAYLTKIAIKSAKELLEAFNEDTSLCNDILNRLEKKEWNVKIFRQISALGILSGDTKESNKNLLLSGDTKGISTFMAYIIFKAMCSIGHHEQAFSIMKRYFNGMLEIGATTFFEDFDLDWTKDCGRIDELPKEGQKDFHGDNGAFCYKGFRHSLCHGWSAGIIAFIVENIMGCKFTKKRRKQLVINPHLCTLKKAELTLPTQYGKIEITHKLREDGSVETTVSAPEEIEVIIKK